MQELTINKPLYGNFIYIYASILNSAIKRKEKLLVHIPSGSAIIDPYTWKIEAIKNSKVMKKVFNFPNDPMILYGGVLPVPEVKGKVEEKEANNLQQLNLL